DHVVGLVALDVDVAEAERLRERRERGPLLLEQVRPRFALRLVLGGDVLAPRPALVPGDDHGLRRVVDEDLGHHRREAVDRVGRPPVRGRDRLGQREEGAISERVPVDQKELLALAVLSFLRHASIVLPSTTEFAEDGGPGQLRPPPATGAEPVASAIGAYGWSAATQTGPGSEGRGARALRDAAPSLVR